MDVSWCSDRSLCWYGSEPGGLLRSQSGSKEFEGCHVGLHASSITVLQFFHHPFSYFIPTIPYTNRQYSTDVTTNYLYLLLYQEELPHLTDSIDFTVQLLNILD